MAADPAPRPLLLALIAHADALAAYVDRRLPPALRSSVDPADVVQDVTIEALRREAEFRPDGEAAGPAVAVHGRPPPPAPTGRTAARRLGAGARGRTAGRSRVALLLHELAVYERTPSQSAVSHETWAAVSRSLGRLPKAQASVIRSRYFERLPAAEVAARTNRTPAAVDQLLKRAMDALRARPANPDRRPCLSRPTRTSGTRTPRTASPPPWPRPGAAASGSATGRCWPRTPELGEPLRRRLAIGRRDRLGLPAGPAGRGRRSRRLRVLSDEELEAPIDGRTRQGARRWTGTRCASELGRGGQGVVYRGRCATGGRDVAIKVLPGGRFADGAGPVPVRHARPGSSRRLRVPGVVSAVAYGAHGRTGRCTW